MVIHYDIDVCLYDDERRSVSFHRVKGDGKKITCLQLSYLDTAEPDLREVTQSPEELAQWINQKLAKGWELLRCEIPELEGLVNVADES